MIGPGEGDTISVSFATNTGQGDTRHGIVVTTNDPEYPAVNLEVHGKVLTPLRIDPTQLLLSGGGRIEEAIEGTVTVKRGDGGPISPRVIGAERRGVEATVREIERGEHYEVDVRLVPPYPNGLLHTSIRLTTGLDEISEASFHVVADFPRRVQMTPGRYVLPHRIDEPLDQSVVFEWIEGTPHKVLRAEANVPELTARVEEKDGHQSVVLHAPAGYQRAAGTFPEVTVYTDDAQLPALSVPIAFSQGPARAQSSAKKIRPRSTADRVHATTAP